MGFFNSNTSSSYSASNIEDLLNEDLNIYEGMSIMEANYAAIAESEMNWNAIMECAAATEMQYFAETGEEYVYTEASGFFGKISEFFKKIWEKIKGLFKKFMVMIGSLWTKDKDFVSKYGETIRRNIKNIPNDTTIKGYVFKINLSDVIPTAIKQAGDKAANISATLADADNFGSAGAKVVGMFSTDSVKNIMTADDWDSTDVNEKIRGELIGDNGGLTSGEFAKNVAEKLRDGESSPIDLDLNSTTVNQALMDLNGAREARRAADKVYKEGEKAFKKIIDKMEKLENKAYKDKPATATTGDQKSKDLRGFNRMLNMVRSISNDVSTMNSLFLTAVKDKYNQDKKMCVKVVTYKNVKEGAFVEHFAEDSVFAGLNLI